MPSLLHSYSPADLGAPEKFKRWRENQAEAVEWIMQSRERFVPIAAPVGSGKSLAYLMAALLGEKRAVVLTSTKGLQDQLNADFRSLGIGDMRGKANYSCREYIKCNCDEAEPRCSFAISQNGCRYREAYNVACGKQLLVTNYAYWLHVQRAARMTLREALCLPHPFDKDRVLNPVQMLVLDEAHNADKELSNFLHSEITVRELEEVLREGMDFFDGLTEDSPLREWRALAKNRLKGLEGLEEEESEEVSKANASHSLRKLKRLKMLTLKLDAVAKMPDTGWVVDKIQNRKSKVVLGYQFDPVWPAQHAEQSLFCGVPRVVLVSGTLSKKALGILGVQDTEYTFKQYPPIFDPKRCPIYWVPTERLTPSSGVTEQQKRSWVRRIDRLIEMRMDRKGLVLVPSFHLQQYFLQHTEHKAIAVFNDTSYGAPDELRTRAVVERFLGARAPRVLVSPSVGTGYDFAGSAAEYLIVGKIPFPDASGKAMQERKKRDPSYLAHIAMQTLEQWAGRIMRYEEDQGEVLVVDDGVGWFMRQYGWLANDWFRRRVKRVDGALPEPPPPLCDQ